MRKNLIAKWILAITMMGFSAYHVFANDKNGAIASFVVGKTFYKAQANSKWLPIKQGLILPEGSAIKTGNGSKITLLYGKSEFRVAQNSEIQLTSFAEGKKEGKVDMVSGFAWFKVDKRPGEKVSVSTQTSTAGVRGTAFATMFDPKTKTAMNCICEGKVEVANLDNSSSLVASAGTGTSVAENGKVVEDSYKDLIVKLDAMPGFEKKIKANPMLNNCLSCHTPKAWKSKGVIKDETYAK